jgi:hypothetical protein
MNLNQNSISAKLYRWFYEKNQHEISTNLCPYFWQLVIMWICIIPMALLSLPANIFYFFSKDSKWGAKENNWLFGIVLWFALYLLQCIVIAIGALFFTYQKDSYLYVNMIIGILATSTVIMIYLAYLFDKRDKNKEKQPSIIKEFIKAKYNKLCPRITWTKNN